MMVLKFGGAVLGSADGLRRMVELVRAHGQGPCVIVVSAMASATRDLEYIGALAVRGDRAAATAAADELVGRHRALVTEMLPQDAAAGGLHGLLDAVRAELDALIEGIAITGQLTPRTLDTVLSVGELLSLHIVRHTLAAAGCTACSVDARRIVVTDEVHGQATPLVEQTSMRVEHDLRPLLASHDCVVVQGFVGRSEQGATTTMGKESSNLTAVLLASVLNVPDVVIYTDVAGVRSGDPAECGTTLPRPSMSYAEARHAAVNGVKILYPTMIDPAERASVTVTIASIHGGAETRIGPDGGPCGPIVITRRVDDTNTTITCVFAAGPAWLEAVRAVTNTSSPSWFDMTWSHADSTGTLTVSSDLAPTAVLTLHDCMTSNETRS
ncbi:MAG: hypothetical protein FGM24_03895 [Candidatus Kapabacteria bacterium]|nr:hypothetical protein [Candidatus Kapabacteria bacterium]